MSASTIVYGAVQWKNTYLQTPAAAYYVIKMKNLINYDKSDKCFFPPQYVIKIKAK